MKSLRCSPLYDHSRPIVRPKHEAVTSGSRSRPSGASQADLAEKCCEQDLYLVEREWHPQADAVAAAEGEPLVKTELSLLEPIGAELVGLGVKFLAALDQV